MTGGAVASTAGTQRTRNPSGPRHDVLATLRTSTAPLNIVEIARPARSPKLAAGQAVRRLVAVLDDLGFAPGHQPSGSRRQIGLRHCPFLELVDAQPGIVSAAHLGLMQGMMSALNTAVTVQRLEPLAEPDRCLVHLGGTAGTGRSSRNTSRADA